MSQSSYAPGQRWISNTESELGLGLIVDLDNRLILVDFPASGEQRHYAADNAPLSRVEYRSGDTIETSAGVSLTVSERQEHNQCYIYLAVDEGGEEQVVHERDLSGSVHVSRPRDRLFAGQIDKSSAFHLRLDTLSHQHRLRASEVFGLVGPRVELLPHQMFIADRVSARYHPRVLLADEVGLGKTIEAGLILHRQIITGACRRVLVVVPEALQHQWLVEMLRRFNLSFTLLDEDRCQGIEESGQGNPFEAAQLNLCAIGLLLDSEQRQEQALAAGWDMLIVDEAHHLHWSPDASGAAYRCIESLAARSHSLLLLTATPEQFGQDSHFARLRLLDPDRYPQLERFVEQEQEYRKVSDLVQALSAEDIEQRLADSPELWQRLEHYLGQDAVAQLRVDLEQHQAADLMRHTIQSLLDRHGTGRVLFRNTREAVEGFPERSLQQVILPPPEDWNVLAQDADLQDCLQPERLLGQQWATLDPRVDWLLDWLRQNRDRKLLLICASATTALELEEYLRVRQGQRTAVFHENMSLVARDRAAAYFADPEEGASVLVCSEIGSEGRNFQFASDLVMFDLPLNPDLLEQRIGRLDRIGQRHTVNIHVPVYQDTAQQMLLAWYQQGLDAFERVCAVGSALYQKFEPRLLECLRSLDKAGNRQLLEDTRSEQQQLVAELQQGRDRLLEMNSCHPDRAAEVVAAVADLTASNELEHFMARVFDQFGVEHQANGPHSIILHPGDHMLVHEFPGLPEDGLTASFRRQQALVREDMSFLTWEHPMVSGAMDLILSGDFGNTCVCTARLPGVAAGTLLIDACFTLICTAPPHLLLQRYLQQTSMHCLVSSAAPGSEAGISRQQLDQRVETIPVNTARELVRHGREAIEPLIDAAEQRARKSQQKLVDEAIAAMRESETRELQRLEALARVNPNIRADEIRHQSEMIEELERYLGQARLHMDALRMVLVTD